MKLLLSITFYMAFSLRRGVRFLFRPHFLWRVRSSRMFHSTHSQGPTDGRPGWQHRHHYAICGLALIFGQGCESYKHAGWTPDSLNYTISLDHQTRETVSYFGIGWSLK